MYQLDAASHFDAVCTLQHVISLAASWSGADQTKPMTVRSLENTEAMVSKFGVEIETLSVPITKLTLRDTKAELAKNRPPASISYIGCAQLLLNLSNTLKRELESVKVFSLDAKRADFYEPTSPPFGPDVAAKFPSIADEVDQAGKCYACDLPTAAAFHWIRCLEAAIRAITRCLGIPDPTTGSQRNWSNISREIKSAMDKKWPTAPDKMTPEYKQFDRMYASLTAMQNPYRNETMHLDGYYTSAAALHLFELTKGLMIQVAARMDENGLPLA